MSTFNLRRYLTAAKAKKDEAKHIDEQLDESRRGGNPPESLTEKQLEKGYRGKEEEITTEKRLESVRTGAGEKLTEGLLEASKSTLHKHRNPDASKGDINKLEEQRLAGKNRQENEKQEPSSTTGKKSRLLDQSTSGGDGLKLAGWGWNFEKTATIVDRSAPEAMWYCRGCGAAYAEKPAVDQTGAACEKCGSDRVARIPGKMALRPTEALERADYTPGNSPIPLDRSKPMPGIQASSKGMTKKADDMWSFEDDKDPLETDPFESYERAARGIIDSNDPTGLGGDDPGLTRDIQGEIDRVVRDMPEDRVSKGVEQDASEEDKPVFEETVTGTTTDTGTKMDIMQVLVPDMGVYENSVGQLGSRGEKKLISDVMAFLATEHPELRKSLTPKMLNTTKIRDGKIYYLVPG